MSGKRVELHSEALAEAEAALTWYREKSQRAATLLFTELEESHLRR